MQYIQFFQIYFKIRLVKTCNVQLYDAVCKLWFCASNEIILVNFAFATSLHNLAKCKCNSVLHYLIFHAKQSSKTDQKQQVFGKKTSLETSDTQSAFALVFFNRSVFATIWHPGLNSKTAAFLRRN